MLSSTDSLLDRPGELQSALELLVARLHDSGRARRHQQAFSAALMQTLETGLRSSFTPEVRGAWQALNSFAAQCLARRVPELSLAAA